MSTGPAGGNGEHEPGEARLSADGTLVAFTTTEQLVAADDDAEIDLYARAGGTTTLISAGPTGSGNPDEAPVVLGISADGSRIVFDAWTQLAAEDTDANRDTYAWSGGRLALLSTGPGDTGDGYADRGRLRGRGARRPAHDDAARGRGHGFVLRPLRASRAA